ncbi:MAG: quinol:cytochrome C oxidoreductase [Bacteroidetes bacterium]|nr:quinol:cytochrome C oxidoreductase [Bacteroidota bacterium]
MGHHYITEVKNEKFVFTKRSRMIVGGVFILGLILTFIGMGQVKNQDHPADAEHTALVVDAPQHEGGAAAAEEATDAGHGEEHAEHSTGMKRIWANFLLNSYYFMLFAVGALFFMAVNYAANAGWATLLKRIMEAMSSYLPIGIITIGIVIYFGRDYLYHWIEYLEKGLKPEDTGFDKILDDKDWFLNKGWFLFGVPAIMLVWWLFRFILGKLSTNEDANGGTTYFYKSIRFSAAFIVIFAFSFSILSWLVMMSIDPHWYSTIYSVYNFAVAFVTTLSVIGLFTLWLKSKGYMEIVSDEVIHDIGKFMFAFSIFWGYIFISQFLLIWYANIPEEVVYFDARLNPHYKMLFRTNILMCFFAPFLILMMRNAKRNPKVMLIAALIILCGHWLDLYLMIMPGVLHDESGFGLLEFGMTIAFAGFFIYWVLHALSRKNLYAINHPYILESVNHDVGV